MATWKSVTENEDFKNLPISEKWKTKTEFFDKTISKSSKYTTLPADKQKKVRSDFLLDTSDIYPSGKSKLGDIAQEAYDIYQKKSPLAVLDKPVEEFAKWVEPEVPAGRTTLGLLTKDLPRQLGAEVIRAYKPSTVGAFYGATKLLKPAGKLAAKAAKPVGKFVWKRLPGAAKATLTKVGKTLTKEFTIGKGAPKEYLAGKKVSQLEKMRGAREAEEVAKVLTIAPKDIKIPLKTGGVKIIKKGQAIPREHQQYVGRIFRQEVDIGGKVSRIAEPPEITNKIAKNVEVEVAFNPGTQKLRQDLELINKTLRDKELLAKGLVGKQFQTKTGFIEKATEVSKIPKIKPSGKPSTKRFDIGLKTEPVAPVEGGIGIPSSLGEEGAGIVRGIKQISQAPTTNKFQNLTRQKLLLQRKVISRQLQKKIKEIEIGVRANYSIFDRTFSEQIRLHPKYQELSEIAAAGRNIMDKWSKELAKSGIPKDQARDVIEENIGAYMARMYSSKMETKASGVGLFKNLRLRLAGLKHRKDLSAEVRKAMGEIKEPALPTAIRVKEISTSIANNKLFKQVAKNPEWVSNDMVSGWTKMPDTASMGVLRGKYVIPEIAQDVNAITQVAAQSQNLYMKALSAWKFGKVVLNPATQVRNMMSNSILLDLSGTSHLRQLKLFPRAFKEYLSKGQIYKQALDDGAIGGEFVGTETMQKMKDFYLTSKGGNLQKWMDVARMPFKAAGKLYQGSEQLAKMVKYIDVLERGGTRQMAATESQKWLFNYNEIPEFVKFGRKYVAPFMTFTYKSLPRLGETLVNRPMALYKYYAMSTAFNESSRKLLGMSPVDYARSKRLLPPWLLKTMGGMPATLLLPFRDKHGRSQWLNLEYILPIGMAPEIMEKGLIRGAIGNPLFNILSDLQKNKDFKNSAILPLEATKDEAMHATVSHIYRQLMPSLAPGIPKVTKGGYSFEKIIDAIKGRPDFAERTRDLTPTLLDTLAGIKITPLDVEEAEYFKMWDKKKRIEELQKSFYKLNHPAVSEEEREKGIENIFQKIERVLEE